VWAEAEEARSRNILIPIAIDGSAPPLVFRQIQTADLSSWEIEPPAPLSAKLLRDLESLIGKPAAKQLEPAKTELSQVEATADPVKVESAVADFQQETTSELVSNNSQSVPEQTVLNQPKKRFSSVHLVGVSALLFVVLAIVFMMKDGQPSVPKIHGFSVQPQMIEVGDTATLSWNTESASKVELKDFGQLALSGSKSVRPEETTIYTLVITNPEGLSIQREVELFVNSVGEVDKNNEAVNELLSAATQAIKARNFDQAEALIKEAQSMAPDSEAVHRVVDYFAVEGLQELLRLAREAIQGRDFTGAKKLLNQARQSGADADSVQQALDYYEASKTLHEQRMAAERRLIALKQAKEKSELEAANKAAAADKWRLEQEAKSRKQAYELEQKRLVDIKTQEQQAAVHQEQEMAEAERLEIEEQEKNLSEEELRARRERTDKFVKDFLKRLHR